MSQAKHLISIVIPAYNAEETIGKTLKSVIEQSYCNLEIIVINDASTDNTIAVIDNNFKNDKRIKIVDSKENKGVHEARLEGLRLASGEYIGFVDADDTCHPNMYQQLITDAISNKADIVICGANRVSENGKVIGNIINFKRNKMVEDRIFDKFCELKFKSGSLCNKLYKKELVKKNIEFASFPWKQKINEDLLLNSLFFYSAKKIYINSTPYYNYTYNIKSVTSRVNKTEAFVFTFQAFALMVNIFAKLDPRVLDNVNNLYRLQLESSSYCIDEISSLKEIDGFQSELNNAINLIYESNPMSLVKLCSRRKFRHRIFSFTSICLSNA